ncbi:hypothetical protein BD769DRAFT_207326 [Suillus cothurnatus]|nr:hypothetical protein BD769DRAFT_207326 [Suillus cothurnatus]
MARKQKMIRCSFQSLPTETICSIFKIVLESMVEDDMMANPENEQVLAGGMSFHHTMALVCRHWRNIVSSTPELWTRIACSRALPLEDQRVTFQLKKAGSYPIHLITGQDPLSSCPLLPLISPHLQRLKSFIINDSLNTLTGDAPQLDCLRLTDIRRQDYYFRWHSCFKLECPALRTLYIDKIVVCNLDHQWLRNNMRHIEVMTIYGCPNYDGYAWGSLSLTRALQAIPRQIPCLILDNLRFGPAIAETHDITIRAEKLILRTCIRDALAGFDGDFQSIVLQECDAIHELRGISLPSSNSLELDRCAAKFGIRWTPKTRPWNGDTVTITNSHSSCIKTILYLLGAPFAHRSCSLWPRVTTLKLIAKGDFVMEFPLVILKAMVSGRREIAGRENLGKDGEEMDGMRPLTVLHVHGAQSLPRKEKTWFKKQVRDFVWD